MALSTTAKKGLWIAQFLEGIGYSKYISENKHTVKIYGDNTASLTLAEEPQLNDRSKHIDIAYHHVRDLAEKNRISVSYIPTREMLSDGLTKPLSRVLFEYHREEMGLTGKR